MLYKPSTCRGIVHCLWRSRRTYLFCWYLWLMCIRTLRGRGPLHGCWTVCRAVNTAWLPMTRITTIQTLVRHTAFIDMIRGCSSMLVRLSRLDSSAVVRNIGYATWGVREQWRLRYSSNMTRAWYYPIFRSLDSLSPPSTGCHRRSCGWHSIGSRFRRRQCSLWRRPTVFDGRRTTWRPWACGVHQIRRGCMGLCRRRLATRVCPPDLPK